MAGGNERSGYYSLTIPLGPIRFTGGGYYDSAGTRFTDAQVKLLKKLRPDIDIELSGDFEVDESGIGKPSGLSLGILKRF
jgi:hypothetical protein